MRIDHLSTRVLAFLLIVAGLGISVAAEQPPGQGTEAPMSKAQQVELGKRMYREGVLPSGEIMTALIQGDIEISGDQVICGFCHRRSGIGTTEGQDVVSPVTGNLLYQPLRTPTSKPPLAPVLRPAYTDETLKRVIREGIDSAGRPIKPLMPRYPTLSDEDLDILIAYLKTLNTDPAPGVTEREMHFATVIADDVDPQARKALLAVLEQFFEQKNVETRNETRRAEHAPRHKEWIFGPYRKWVLHVWELQGPAQTWPQQLEAYYRQQPVFAMLSGMANGSWRPVHDFCQAQQLPCVFPLTDLPVIAEDDFYVVYLSKGMTLEAQSIARYHITGELSVRPVIQVYRKGDIRGRTAATALEQALAAVEGRSEVVPWDMQAQSPEEFWAKLQNQTKDAVLVLWLDQTDLASAWPNIAATGPARLYLSSSLWDAELTAIPTGLKQRLYVVQASALAAKRSRLLVRSRGWLRHNRIYDPAHEQVQADAFFTAKLMAEGVKSIRGFFVRDYLLERLEHMVDNATFTSVYPRVSLAPGQRFVVKGAYIAKLSQAAPNKLEAVTDWVIPR